ncbi:hypothetical protein EZV62_006964 [Acer yangbiense]|uniref:Uncharacterized protein n=1 Tax=Acer yangbiense TaxID=1000413 RepID=A0A5C7IAB9_9ROSI|nr:hypothetical protein EZV62_006964 [Acer yangbiense]
MVEKVWHIDKERIPRILKAPLADPYPKKISRPLRKEKVVGKTDVDKGKGSWVKVPRKKPRYPMSHGSLKIGIQRGSKNMEVSESDTDGNEYNQGLLSSDYRFKGECSRKGRQVISDFSGMDVSGKFGPLGSGLLNCYQDKAQQENSSSDDSPNDSDSLLDPQVNKVETEAQRDKIQEPRMIVDLRDQATEEPNREQVEEGRHSQNNKACSSDSHESQVSIKGEHEAGHFLLGYLLGVLPKGLQGTSTEVLRQGNFGMSLQSCDCRFEPQCMYCPCMQVAVPRMLKKDTSQLDDRSLNNFSCVILGGLAAEHKISTRMDKSDDACIDIKSLATTCLRGKSENLYPLSKDCCIYRVPEFRKSKGSHITPQIVSIGPLHHGREELKAMEEHKLRYSKWFLQRSPVSLEDFLICIKSKEEKLRNCYAETISLASQDFVEMILLDAIFLIEFLFLYNACYAETIPLASQEFVTSGDRIFGKPWLLPGIMRDIWSVENQIPFFILEDLFKLAKTRDLDECYDGLSISKLVTHFCRNIHELLLIDESLFEINFSRAKHFVDLLRLCIEPSDHRLDIVIETMYSPTLPTITELHQAGVKFEVGSNQHLFDIRFDEIKGTLEIPKLRMAGISIYYFKNLQVFEALHCKTNHVNDYAMVLGLLVRTPKDAELLIQNGILENTESIAASTFCGEIGKQARVLSNRFYYRGLTIDLTDYCKSPWRKWNANLKQNYFNSPWASISVIAAVLLLLLTITQTVCSIVAL